MKKLEDMNLFVTKEIAYTKHLLYETDTDLVVLVGHHGSGKSSSLSVLTDYCPIRPLAFFFSCHPLYRQLLFNTFFSEIELYSWNSGGIIFADEYGDNDDIAPLMNFIASKNGRMVVTCHPEDLNTIMRLGSIFNNREIVNIETIDREDAQKLWKHFSSDNSEIKVPELWEAIYELANGVVGTYLRMIKICFETPECTVENLDVVYEKFYIQDKQEQKQRAGLYNRAYVVRYPDGTETRHRANTPNRTV